MIEQTRDEIEYYYDSHPTEEDLMGESRLHAELVHYLMEVLKWLFRDQLCAIYENFNFYQTRNKDEKPLAPDIAIITGVAHWSERSWRVGSMGPRRMSSSRLRLRRPGSATWKKSRTCKHVWEYRNILPMTRTSRRSGAMNLTGSVGGN